MRSIGLVAAWLTMLAPAAAQIAVPVAPSRPGPAAQQTAKLDAALAAKDYLALGPLIGNPPDQATMTVDLDWLRDRMIGGTTSFVALLYARNLWALAAELPEPTRTSLRETAVMATLYTYGAIEIDGERCDDRTAPTHRIEQLLTLNPGLITFYQAMPADRKARAVEAALLIERRTAAVRDATGDVAFVCFGGLDEMQYNLAHGTSREVTPRPGEIGRRIEVTGDGKYQPKEVPMAERSPKMAVARKALSMTLEALGKSGG